VQNTPQFGRECGVRNGLWGDAVDRAGGARIVQNLSQQSNEVAEVNPAEPLSPRSSSLHVVAPHAAGSAQTTLGAQQSEDFRAQGLVARELSTEGGGDHVRSTLGGTAHPQAQVLRADNHRHRTGLQML